MIYKIILSCIIFMFVELLYIKYSLNIAGKLTIFYYKIIENRNIEKIIVLMISLLVLKFYFKGIYNIELINTCYAGEDELKELSGLSTFKKVLVIVGIGFVSLTLLKGFGKMAMEIESLQDQINNIIIKNENKFDVLSKELYEMDQQVVSLKGKVIYLENKTKIIDDAGNFVKWLNRK